MFVQDEPLVYLRLDEVDDVDEVLVLLQKPPTLRGPSDYDEGDGVAPLGVVGRVQGVEREDGCQGHQEHVKPPAVSGIIGRIKKDIRKRKFSCNSLSIEVN